MSVAELASNCQSNAMLRDRRAPRRGLPHRLLALLACLSLKRPCQPLPSKPSHKLPFLPLALLCRVSLHPLARWRSDCGSSPSCPACRVSVPGLTEPSQSRAVSYAAHVDALYNCDSVPPLALAADRSTLSGAVADLGMFIEHLEPASLAMAISLLSQDAPEPKAFARREIVVRPWASGRHGDGPRHPSQRLPCLCLCSWDSPSSCSPDLLSAPLL